MNNIRIYARAKINLTLDVLGKRENGYHDVQMVMQTIKLADIVDVHKTNKYKIELTTNLFFLPTDERNIAYKACILFFEHTKVRFTGVKIEIFKKIPVCAGLAGGSTNAAAVLIALNRLYKTKLTIQELMKLSESLGADVPFCVHGGTMLAEGVGEKLKKLTPVPRTKLILCKPPFSVSTAKAYAEVDAKKIKYHPNTSKMLQAINEKNINDITKYMYNVLEDVTTHKDITNIKRTLNDYGSMGVLMSGSGPTVYGLFEDENDALKAYAYLKTLYKDTYISEISTYINKP